jgi:hypothetical protein
MLRKAVIVSAVVLLVAGSAARAVDVRRGADSITVTLRSVNGSGQSGVAVLTATQTKVSGFDVVVRVRGRGLAPDQQAHIHDVTCAAYQRIAPKPRNPTQKQFDRQAATVYAPLTNLRGGRSKTSITLPLESFTKGGLSINVHRSGYPYMAVACGTIPKR